MSSEKAQHPIPAYPAWSPSNLIRILHIAFSVSSKTPAKEESILVFSNRPFYGSAAVGWSWNWRRHIHRDYESAAMPYAAATAPDRGSAAINPIAHGTIRPVSFGRGIDRSGLTGRAPVGAQRSDLSSPTYLACPKFTRADNAVLNWYGANAWRSARLDSQSGCLAWRFDAIIIEMKIYGSHAAPSPAASAIMAGIIEAIDGLPKSR